MNSHELRGECQELGGERRVQSARDTKSETERAIKDARARMRWNLNHRVRIRIAQAALSQQKRQLIARTCAQLMKYANNLNYKKGRYQSRAQWMKSTHRNETGAGHLNFNVHFSAAVGKLESLKQNCGTSQYLRKTQHTSTQNFFKKLQIAKYK